MPVTTGKKPLAAVIFDLDDTLYTQRGLHDKAVANMARYARTEFGISEEAFQEEFLRAREETFAEMPENGTAHSRLIWVQRICEKYGWNPFVHALKLEAAYWEYFIERIRPKEGALECLQNLKAAGVKTALCTDMQLAIQYRKIEKLGFGEYLDVMVASDLSGADKPNPLTYRETLRRLKTSPEETVMVGDNLKKDVFGPMAIGIGGIWFNDYGQPEEGITAPVVHSHDELWQLLRERL